MPLHPLFGVAPPRTDDSEGLAVASAATTDIWATASNAVHVTGTVTITSFGTAPRAGAGRWVIFDAALTLTDGANLNLPGAANITTAADDFAFVYAETTTLFKVLYFKERGTATVSPYRSLSVTHASDTALATRASGGTQIGSNLTNVLIPTSGIIRMTILEAEFDETGSSAASQVAFAVDVGGTKVFAVADTSAGAALDVHVLLDTGVASRLIGSGRDDASDIANIMSFDIAVNSFPTGSRTIQVYFGDEANSTTGAATLTGTTVTCRILIEVIDTT